MKKLLLLLCIGLLALSSCDDCGRSGPTREFRLRDPKTGAVSIEKLNTNYHVGDTVAIDLKKTIVVITDTIASAP